jgi:hypothetical protein
VRRPRLARFGGGALGLPLEEQGMGHQMAGLALRDSERVRPLQLGLRGDALPEQQIGARLGHSKDPVVRLGLDRVQEFDPGGARLALGQRLKASTIGRVGRFRPRVGAGGGAEQKQGGQGGARAHGCRSYCFIRS